MLRFKWETEFKETEIGEIPRDWEVNKLSYDYDVIMGQSPSSKFYNENGEGILFIQGNKEFQEVFVKPNIFTSKCHKIAPKNSVLITVRAPVGSVNLTQEEICIGRGVAAINHKNNDIDKNKFCYYLLRGLKSYIARFGERGTTYDSITKDDLENLPMLYPLPEEQFRIATVLSWFDDLIENKKKQNEILEKTAMAIFKSWFVDFEPFQDEEFVYNEELDREIPKGWEVKKIGEIFHLIKGKKCAVFENAKEDALPYLLIENFKESEISYWTNEKEPFVEELDIVLVADGESSGKIFRYQRGVIGSTLLVLKQKETKLDLRNYVYLYLKNVENEIMKHRTGSAIPHLDKVFLKEYPLIIPVPPVLQRFHSLVEPLFQKIILNQKQIMVLRKVRDALLPQLVFGKLRVVEL